MSITAVLAPTNTGKTHRAIMRMLEHPTGMIGLPLRLLAREIYDRLTTDLGESAIALVTGEEKRVPPAPRYWVCTVESMPISREVDFLAVDEIQLAAHRQRGHVFTDRLLHARGLKETWFMGADTMRPLIEQLLPEARINRHPRLSQLRHAGAASLRSLPPRTAVVAFSVPQVYELAERLRQRHGGVAVVLGALSPRTRNAQVALYQSGEVQYMVATDAIGMGLNMDVDHIAFAALRKFDGRDDRDLEPDELAQIAGRAGRYQRDGSFGTLSPLPELPERVVSAIETHRFQPVQRLVWRNSELDTSSLDALITSLSRRPEMPELSLVEHAEDFSSLLRLAAQPDIRERVTSREAVELLWEVCQVPDFRKLLEDSHVRLLGEMFRQLSGPAQRIDPDWMDVRVSRLDDISGDIDMLTQRIAFVRTWTYVSHQTQWVRDAAHWRERTRAIEDRLSDALHERLVQRFVERQQRRQSSGARVTQAQQKGNPFAKLKALLEDKADLGIESWVAEVADAEHTRFSVDGSGIIRFDTQVIGRLIRGADILKPGVTLMVQEDLGAGAHARLLRRLTAWTRDVVTEILEPLRRPEAQELSPAGRGLMYQLEQGLGTVVRRQAADQLRELLPRDRKLLRAMDVRIGGYLVYVPSLLAPAALAKRVALASVYMPGLALPLPPPGAASIELRVNGKEHGKSDMRGDARGDIRNDIRAGDGRSGDIKSAEGRSAEERASEIRPADARSGEPRQGPGADAYTWIGYPAFGPRGIRADLAERVYWALVEAAKGGPFAPPAPLASWIGCRASALPEVISAFGYRQIGDGRFISLRRRRRRGRSAARGDAGPNDR